MKDTSIFPKLVYVVVVYCIIKASCGCNPCLFHLFNSGANGSLGTHVIGG